MRRRPKCDVDAERAAVEAMTAFAGPLSDKPKRTRNPAPPSRIVKLASQVAQMVNANEWSEASHWHLAALHAVLFKWTYGVEIGDYHGPAFAASARAAKAMLQSEFAGSIDAMLTYIRWVWRREQRLEKWKRENGIDSGSLKWQSVYVRRSLLVEYKIAMERRNG